MHMLRRDGIAVSRKRVASLMRREGLVARQRKRFKVTTDSRHQEPIAPNLLQRKFSAENHGDAMVGDTTAIETKEGWLYLAVMLDLCTRAVVGWSVSETNDTALISAAFKGALKHGFRRGFIHHTDRGSTYASRAYRVIVEAAGGRRSMSGTGDCYDNAVAESFFRTLKEEGIGNDTPPTVAKAREAAFSFIEGFYNHERLHSTLGYRTPMEFKKMKMDDASRIQQGS